jgi:Fic family protein
VPGQYKTQPNNVRTATGEMFHFVDPLDVSQRMHEHMRIVNAAPPSAADLPRHLAKIHHEFLLIHPFDDGNGRVGRLLLNYVLLKHGWLPVIIRTEEKRAYLSALHRADTEERDYTELGEYLAAGLRTSLELGIKTARGGLQA